MKKQNIYNRYRFPSEIIQYAVWLYYRFNPSRRRCVGPLIEDLLAERGINVTYETIRLWCNKFGPKYANRLKRKHRGYGDTFFIDEVFIEIDGKQHYLWRAVDQESLPRGAQPMSEANALAEASGVGMVKSLMCISRNGEMARQPGDSLKDY